MPNPPRLPLDRYELKAVYADGSLRQATFIAESFYRSKCFQIGGANCGTCHLVHRLAEPPGEDPLIASRLLRPEAMTNAVCTGCHPALAVPARLSGQTRHLDILAQTRL